MAFLKFGRRTRKRSHRLQPRYRRHQLKLEDNAILGWYIDMRVWWPVVLHCVMWECVCIWVCELGSQHNQISRSAPIVIETKSQSYRAHPNKRTTKEEPIKYPKDQQKRPKDKRNQNGIRTRGGLRSPYPRHWTASHPFRWRLSILRPNSLVNHSGSETQRVQKTIPGSES